MNELHKNLMGYFKLL